MIDLRRPLQRFVPNDVIVEAQSCLIERNFHAIATEWALLVATT